MRRKNALRFFSKFAGNLEPFGENRDWQRDLDFVVGLRDTTTEYPTEKYRVPEM
jgi:hypothetical protein